jgi:Baseplate J-like protein
MIYFCSQKARRARVLQCPTLNGIDYLEVASDDGSCGCGKRLLLTLLHDAQNVRLDPTQVQIAGGGAEAQVHVLSVSPGNEDSPLVVTIELDQSGDFSTYTLTLVATPGVDDPPDGFDPQLSQVDFSFKAGCPTVGDCLPDNCCPPAAASPPDINYLAKDYEGFRQVMLDRMAVLTSDWNEAHVPDIGIALVEILAYVADHLSYQQDSIGTESYLGTARSRISLRRHAKLVDYRLDEGCNARTWVYFEIADAAAQDGVCVPKGTQIFPRVPGLPCVVQSGSREAGILRQTTPAFTTLHPVTLWKDLTEMKLYTWKDANCCLPPGSTEATLLDAHDNLAKGDVLIFEEVKGPDSGDKDDADPAKRWAVMLTKVRTHDCMGRRLVDPLDGTPITRIQWSVADALPFPLCISSTTDAEHGQLPLTDVSVARGNVAPADQGLWLEWEDLGEVPVAPTTAVPQNTCSCNSTSPIEPARPRFNPQLAKSPLTFALKFTPSSASAFLTPPGSSTTVPKPELRIKDDQDQEWEVLDDLLSSDSTQNVCVVEIERDGTAFLRFGDGEYGSLPQTGTSFRAHYRTGIGTAGNVGRDALAHAIIDNLVDPNSITAVRNPLAATGGVDPESMEHIRQQAPFAFRTQLRAVTEADYGTMAAQDPSIREARGTLRWTGSWYTAFVSIDSVAENLPPALITATENRLDLLRMIGTDLDVEGAIIVGLRIEMTVCVDADHIQGDVEAAIERLLITGERCDGQPGILNPAQFTFGQTIYASPIVTAVQAVEGVTSVTLNVLQRMDDPSIDGAAQGYLTMGRLEVARCDNDPDRLDRGKLVLHMDGGK